ncbi:S-adenosylmethionine:tRNA ribosyltransferase-isomerase [soil metagenome]
MTAVLEPLDGDTTDGAALDFALPDELVATVPAEARGLDRDGVRLLVASRRDGSLVNTSFAELGRFLRAGDLLVVNTSATLPAAVPTRDGLLVHLSTRSRDGSWLVELRRPAGAGSLAYPHGHAGMVLALPAGASVELVAPQRAPGKAAAGPARLWGAHVRVDGDLHDYLHRHGHPIRYGADVGDWPLAAYQTVFADEPGSAEMPSAGRGFTPRLVTELVTHGIGVSPIVLHTGVSSQEADEPPYAERYRVPAVTAQRVNTARATGGRVIAIGTTVTRALETTADANGVVHAGEGWTEHVVSVAGGVHAVDGIISGWHEPRASHLALLEAIAGRELLQRSYLAALAGGYRWHEFGDLHLIV